MKISFYDAFELIADEAIELLVNSDEIEKQLEINTYEQTIQDVYGLIENNRCVTRKKKKKISLKIKFLIAAVIIMMMSTLSLALQNKGAQLFSALSKSFIEAKEGFSIVVEDSMGNVIQGNKAESPDADAWKSSKVINRVGNNILLPYTVKEFETECKDGKYIVPEIIFWNGDMVIFTKEDGSGWQLNKGDSLILELENNDDKNSESKYISFGYVYNGKLVETEKMIGQVNQPFEIVAEKKGEYYICIMNVGVDSITFRGEIRMENEK